MEGSSGRHEPVDAKRHIIGPTRGKSRLRIEQWRVADPPLKAFILLKLTSLEVATIGGRVGD